MAGGQQLEVMGRGLDGNMTITICDKPCNVVTDTEVTPMTLTCRTPAYSGSVLSEVVGCEVKASAGNVSKIYLTISCNL